MQVINKIIFNTLASREKVVLPGIGTLWVERTDVSKDRKGKVIPPYNKLFFSTEVLPQRTIIDIIISKSDVPREDVEYAYVKWVDEVSLPQPNNFIIAGVCTINGDNATASKELDGVLNPFAAEITEFITVKKEKKSNNGLIWSVVIALIVIAAAAAYYLLYYSAPQPVEPKPVPVVKPEIKVSDTVKMTQDSVSAEDVIMQQLAGQGDKRLQLDNVESYHLIAGVFSSEQNALRQIESDSKLKSFKCQIIKTPKGMFLISIGVFTNKQIAQGELEKLDKTISGCWIYREPK